jgi:putative peptide zinc metalloprotease protein
MGAMFILFSPFLFCNATDSWTFRDKKKRFIVTFGGIYLELFLAAVAAALWVITPPGLFNQVCFNVMLVCSVMTIFFNANPLMKFDGYYALSDFLEIPNLKERGDKALVSRLAGFLTGGEGISRDPLVESAKGVVLTYAVASYAWTFTIAYNILLAIGGMLQPYGLDRLAQSVAGLVLLVGIVAPPLMVGMHIKNLFKQGGSDQLRSRVLRRGTLAVLTVAVVLSIPWPVHTRTACAIDSAQRIRVTAAVDGYVRQVAVDDAQRVSSGEILAVMENPLLVTQLASLQAELGAAQAQLDAASAEGSTANLGSLRGVCAQLRSALDKMREDEKSLQLRAPSAGKVIGRDLPMLKGRLLRRGELFCEIVPDGPLVVVVALDERSAGKVGPGQKADFRLRSLPGIEFSGKVISVESIPSRTFPHEALGAHAGGTVPSSAAGQAPGGGLQTLPTGAVYEAKVAIDNPDGILRPGMSGRLRIEGGKKPLGAILWDSITSMIRTDFRL